MLFSSSFLSLFLSVCTKCFFFKKKASQKALLECLPFDRSSSRRLWRPFCGSPKESLLCGLHVRTEFTFEPLSRTTKRNSLLSGLSFVYRVAKWRWTAESRLQSSDEKPLSLALQMRARWSEPKWNRFSEAEPKSRTAAGTEVQSPDRHRILIYVIYRFVKWRKSNFL